VNTAIHIHEKADCSSADGIVLWRHWDPTFAPHGKWWVSEMAIHKGDIGNFTADLRWHATVEFSTNEWLILGCDDEAKKLLGRSNRTSKGSMHFITQTHWRMLEKNKFAGIIE